MRARRGRAVRSASQPGPCHGRRLAGCRARDSSFRARGTFQARATRTMVRWRAGAARASIASCKTKPQRHRQPQRSGAPPSRGCRRSCARPSMRPLQTAPPSTRSRPSSEGRAASVLALGRRPLHQERARPDPPTAGGRPRQRGVGAGARRAPARPCRAHPDRDPADFDALHPGRTQQARDAADAGRARPPVAGSQAHRGHRQAPPQREQAAAKAARAAPGAGQAPVRKGLSPEAVAAIREVVEGRPRPPERAVTSAPVDPWNPAESHLIPLNPGPKNGALPEMDGGSGSRR